jgi:hypothetical protein
MEIILLLDRHWHSRILISSVPAMLILCCITKHSHYIILLHPAVFAKQMLKAEEDAGGEAPMAADEPAAAAGEAAAAEGGEAAAGGDAAGEAAAPMETSES